MSAIVRKEGVTGFAMLEVLITMLLMTLALLGTAAMQAYGVKVTQGAQFRGQAVLIAADLMERIEANNVGAIGGNYVATSLDSVSAPDCTANRCSPSEIAQYDLDAIRQNLAMQLPGGTAQIAMTGAGPFTYTVTLTWQERSFKSKSSRTASEAPVETFTFTLSRTVYNRGALI